MSIRESLPNSVKQLRMAFLMAIATSLGGGAVAMFTSWWGGIITESKLSTALELKADVSKLSALETRFGKLPDNAAPVCEQLQSLQDAKLFNEIRIGVEVKERMGIQVGLYQAMRLAKLNEAQRTSVERSMISAKARHDFLLLNMRMTPVDAAKQVVDEYKVQVQR